MCKFNHDCAYSAAKDIAQQHRPAIGSRINCACPFPASVGHLSFHKGDALFLQGDRVRGGFSLTSGLVSLERVDEDGRQVVLKVLRPGAFFPCADLFSDAVHGTEARARTDVRACFIPLERIDAALTDKTLRNALLRSGADEARENENTMFRLTAGALPERILWCLEEVLSGCGGEPETTEGLLPLCWHEMAAMIGTSPEVLSRTLRRMVKDGRLKMKGRYVKIVKDAAAPNAAALRH